MFQGGGVEEVGDSVTSTSTATIERPEKTLEPFPHMTLCTGRGCSLLINVHRPPGLVLGGGNGTPFSSSLMLCRTDPRDSRLYGM